jgi:hypothetical protein
LGYEFVFGRYVRIPVHPVIARTTIVDVLRNFIATGRVDNEHCVIRRAPVRMWHTIRLPLLCPLRHYRREAALAAMSWRIRWYELTGDENKASGESKANEGVWWPTTNGQMIPLIRYVSGRQITGILVVP